MNHLIELVAEFGRSLVHRRVANPAKADQQQQRENEDCGHSPTWERRKGSADEEDSEQEVPAPDPPEAGIEQDRAYRIGIECRRGRTGHVGGHREQQGQRRQQRDDCTDDRHAPEPGIEGGKSAGECGERITAEPINPEGAAPKHHDD